MRKTFLEHLPKKGKAQKKINWMNSVGMTFKFIYDGIEGEIKIVEYISNEKIKLYYPEKDRYIYMGGGHIKEAKIGVLLGVVKKDFLYKTGDVLTNKNRSLTILDTIIENGEKKYKCKCNIDGYEWITSKSNLEHNNVGCPCCVNQVVVTEINSMWKTDYWMVELGVNEEESKTVIATSTCKVSTTCKYCGKKGKDVAVNIYNRKSIKCTCGDGFSYPEKFVVSLLNQINIPYEYQFLFEWSGLKRYDFYIPSLNMIIETHGMQHYEQTRRKGARTLEEEQENDRLKERLARENRIENYVVLDCRNSELEWIKESILGSSLSKLLNLSSIDWNRCEEYALSNLVKEVCDYYNSNGEYECMSEIDEKYNISRGTNIKFLKRGTKLGWCNYDPKLAKSLASRKLNKKNGKEICVFTMDDVFICKYANARELERRSVEDFGFEIGCKGVSAVCNNKRNHYLGLKFKFSSDCE